MVVHSVLRSEEPADPSPGSGNAIGLETRGDSDGASVRRRELAVFLRSRRERLSPSELAIVATTRRRTPRLRREGALACLRSSLPQSLCGSSCPILEARPNWVEARQGRSPQATDSSNLASVALGAAKP
ncbi:hypothetical protein CG723_36215 [Streptomyces sp. CB01635]|nr:hypothetical protein CG723_36215 [Streptomyces sp. CB01635]